jgi:hypothetical protein
LANVPVEDERFRYFQSVLATAHPGATTNSPTRLADRATMLSNWDPSYPSEQVDWYSEFIHREAPIAISWLQQPRNRESPGREYFEVRGVGIYDPPGNVNKSFAVAPLDDGSICLWNLRTSAGRHGEIAARSTAGTLSQSGAENQERSKMISTGVTECVSIDNERGKAYIAVQSCKLQMCLASNAAIKRPSCSNCRSIHISQSMSFITA